MHRTARGHRRSVAAGYELLRATHSLSRLEQRPVAVPNVLGQTHRLVHSGVGSKVEAGAAALIGNRVRQLEGAGPRAALAAAFQQDALNQCIYRRQKSFVAWITASHTTLTIDDTGQPAHRCARKQLVVRHELRPCPLPKPLPRSPPVLSPPHLPPYPLAVGEARRREDGRRGARGVEHDRATRGARRGGVVVDVALVALPFVRAVAPVGEAVRQGAGQVKVCVKDVERKGGGVEFRS